MMEADPNFSKLFHYMNCIHSLVVVLSIMTLRAIRVKPIQLQFIRMLSRNVTNNLERQLFGVV